MIGGWRMWAMLVACCAALAAGCGEPPEPVDIHVEYGRQRGRAHGDSVNGTAVIAKMFSQAGHRVTARSALSPAIEAADVIVWFPDDFDPPEMEARRWFEAWLRGGFGRTLVYVGRDYDAEPLYWQKAIAKAPPERREEMRERLSAARVRVAATRFARTRLGATPREQAGRRGGRTDKSWFHLARTEPPPPSEGDANRPLGELRGEWSAEVDGSRAEIELNDVLTVGYDDEPLLYTEESTIAAWVQQPEFGDGRLLVVQNGSFLLNLALVNHEHRRLAGELIDAVESRSGSGADVVFLESDADGPTVHDREPQVQPPTEADYPPPISDMLYHAIALAIVVTVGSWPIFGRPRRLASPPLSDFGQHVESLGDLLRRSRDEGYCRDRVAQWTERERR